MNEDLINFSKETQTRRENNEGIFTSIFNRSVKKLII